MNSFDEKPSSVPLATQLSAIYSCLAEISGIGVQHSKEIELNVSSFTAQRRFEMRLQTDRDCTILPDSDSDPVQGYRIPDVPVQEIWY